MKKIFTLLMIGILLMGSAALAEAEPKTIQSMTELGDIQKKLDQGITIGKAYYTAGYGFSTCEFSTEDPDEIEQLWNAVNAITVGEKVDEFITDWYPQIVFYLTDGTYGSVGFDADWLSIGGMENYEISNAEDFWNLTASLAEKYDVAEVVDGGWGTASNPEITDEVRALFDKALNGFVGVNYVPVTYLGMQVIAGYNHAILCQATTVYPGAVPRWVIMYLFEDLEGNVTITDIEDLNW